MLPQNRRLRHLQGIYLRNLSFSVNRGRTIDDLDADFKSNNNNNELEIREDDAPQIHQSQSTDSLRPRPKGRRRSTTLANISPVTRQKQLEYAVQSRTADIFFSLHCEGIDEEEEPLYISEVGSRATNFNFRFFNLAELGPFITRTSIFTVQVWAKRWDAWSLLLEQHVDLRSLNYLGTTLRNRQFPPNCLVFHLADGSDGGGGGVYALELANQKPEPKQSPALPTSSYNALMKLSNLDTSIQDALATRETLTAQINEILSSHTSNTSSTNMLLPQAQESALLASRYLTSQKRALKAAQSRRSDLRASIDARRAAIHEGRAAQSQAEAEIQRARDLLPALRAQVTAAREAIRGQRRRICEDLGRIYGITPETSPGAAPLSFRICGVALPNTSYDPSSASAAEDALSAALGYVAQLVDLLQFYLGVPLPYPVTPFGSRSSVRDDISLLPDTTLSSSSPSSYAAYGGGGGGTAKQQQQRYRQQLQRDFPLFLRGGATAQYRFDYAWFLLNKDVEALCAVGAGLRVVDIRHTLPNLKYLLYVCSAGTEEVPERKRGGVRGLWAGRMMRKSRNNGWGSLSVGSASAGGVAFDDGASSAGGSSRRGSTDSEVLAGSGGGQDQLKMAMAAAAASENGHTQQQQQEQQQQEHLHVLGGGAEGSTYARQQLGSGHHHSPSSSSSSRSPLGVGVDIGGGLPFDEAAGARLTLRTKGLRENVGAHA